MTPLSTDRLALLRAALAEKGLATPLANALPRRADPTRAPLSLNQERLYFLELFRPGTALHNDAIEIAIEGALDPGRLASALKRVAARHEMLRTTFVLAGEGPEQRIHAACPCEPRLVDLAGGSPDAQELERRARELARTEARTPFDLEQAPPWRVTLARLAPAHWRLVLTMHHILSDGASVGLFFDELAHFYANASGELVPLAVQFGDYAAWERSTSDEGRIEADLAHWKRVLGASPTPAPFPESHGLPDRTGAQIPLWFEASLVQRLEELARTARTTSNQLLLAAWLALLSRVTGARAARTGIARSLRQRRELEPLIGFFVQSLPLEITLDGDPDFLELARRVRVAALEADAHAAPPFDRIARALAPTGTAARAPTLVRAFFSHMRDAIRAPDLPDARTSWSFVDPGVARFELSLVLHESAAGLRGFLEYDLGVFTPEVAGRLAEEYARLLRALVERPELRLSEVSSPLVRGADTPAAGHNAGPRLTHARGARRLPPRRRASGE